MSEVSGANGSLVVKRKFVCARLLLAAAPSALRRAPDERAAGPGQVLSANTKRVEHPG